MNIKMMRSESSEFLEIYDQNLTPLSKISQKNYEEIYELISKLVSTTMSAKPIKQTNLFYILQKNEKTINTFLKGEMHFELKGEMYYKLKDQPSMNDQIKCIHTSDLFDVYDVLKLFRNYDVKDNEISMNNLDLKKQNHKPSAFNSNDLSELSNDQILQEKLKK